MIEKIPLEGRIKGGASLGFISVEVPLEPGRHIPFALVRYSIDQHPQGTGLRLDLDKCTFADHFEGDRELVLRAAARPIVEVVAERLRQLAKDEIRAEILGTKS